ncbi:MAG: hypothetical protein KF724_03370 [Phycisphaeraceae bacterium]|nr:hypothetical protein [Phycisphaeraceae bacterium]
MRCPSLLRSRAALVAGVASALGAVTLLTSPSSAQARRPQPAPQPEATVQAESSQDEAPAAPRRVQPQAQPDGPQAGALELGQANGQGNGVGPAPVVVPAAATPPGNDLPALVVPDGSIDDNGAFSVISGTRRPGGEERVKLVASQTRVKEFIKFIAEVTGKSVIPRLTTAGETPITIVSDREVTRREALDLIFQAFRVNDIAVVETDRYIFIDSMGSVGRLGPHPVLGPEVDVLSLVEDGQWVYKIFKIQNTKVDALASRITDLPDSASLTPDPNSNQLIFFGDLSTAKRVQRLVNVLDTPAYVDVQTKTFRLQWADASQVASFISELFAARGTSGGAAAGGAQPRVAQPARPGQPQPRPAGATGGGELVGTSEQLLVSVIPALNSITVRAEPSVMREIERLIQTAWDVNPSSGGQIFKYYDLRYTDPLKVREVLSALLESGGSGGARGGAGRGGLGGGVAGRVQTGGGGESGADVAVANIFRIEAYPDSNRLLVISKTPDNFKWLDEMIADLDQPLRVGLPLNVPLKHANAVEMAEILNALLAPAGADARIRAPETGLTGIDFTVLQGGSSGSSAGTAGASGQAAGTGQEIRFPWQSARGAGESAQNEVSAIVGKSRVVPNANQNSLLVLATPEIQEALLQIIEDLDVPGRQVMITAILAEVQLGDQLAYGLQFGPAGLAPTNPNNAIVISGTGDAGRMFAGSREGDFIGDLTTSILSFGVDATVILQALDQVTNVSILQSPRIYTSDNKEAKFFDGQDVPFQSQATTQGTAGGTTASFEQIPVGIGLNVRPRITKERNVYMDIEVLLSNQNPTSPQGVGGNPVIDRRQTNTKITVKNGQTIVISGIRKEQRNFQKTKVPFLGDIPGLDLIFAFTDDTTTTKELVVFITPVVVDNPDENDSNFNVQERRRLRELAQPLRERSDKLIRGAGFTPMSDLKDDFGGPLMPELPEDSDVNPAPPSEPTPAWPR